MIFFLVVLTASAAVNAEPDRVPADDEARLENRIVGGQNATIQTYPYQISIQRKNGSLPFKHTCGGTIVSSHYVVTAGHCTTQMKLLNHTIHAGSSFWDKEGSVHEIEWVKNHTKFHYRKGIPVFDAAVIRVKQPFILDETRQPIKLMDKKVKPGTMATVTGWGKTQTNQSIPEQLQVVNVPIVDKKDCRKAYRKKARLPEDQICAGYLDEGGKDSCQGDSGGPLVVNGKLTGIVSWGEGCAKPAYPGLYTEVAQIRDWIVKTAEL